MDKDYDKDIEEVDFFQDFITFLHYLEKQPIKRTITGNISLNDIANLQPLFREQKVFTEHKKYGWSIRTETEIEFLTQIKIIAEVMHLTYKRKNKLLLSKNGKAFLQNLEPVSQYKNMVLSYWREVSWSYIHPGRFIQEEAIADIFQYEQNLFWDTLLKNGDKWIDFVTFCKSLKEYLHLGKFYEDAYGMDDFELMLDIEYGLIERNIGRFGCVESEWGMGDHGIKRIMRFRPTNLGLWMFSEALNRNSDYRQ